MIKVLNTSRGRAVAVFCDSCEKRIRNARLAVVVAGPGRRAMFAHKGGCHKVLAEIFPGTSPDGFLEFSEALAQTAANSGADRRA
jgi:hypothetical protein